MQFVDKELGRITVTVNSRARSIIMRAEVGGLRVTIPPYTTRERLMEVLEKHREQLKKKQTKVEQQKHFYDFDYKIDTDRMQLRIVKGTRDGFFVNRSAGFCEIICPSDTDFIDKQAWLEKVIVEQLRIQAKVLLYNRTLELAKEHGFHPTSIKIQASHTRWGSCSARNSINLSLYLMTVPGRLIDYVILHELCHTVEHNHGTGFWTLMDKVTGCKARELDSEMKNYHTEV